MVAAGVLYEAIRAQDSAKVAALLESPPSSPTASHESGETGSNVSWTEWRDPDGFTLLHWAAMGGVYELILLLVMDMKMDVNVKGPNLQTPIMWAAIEDRILTMILLKDLGAEVDARDDLGDNLVTLSAQHERLFSCLWAIRNGADIDAANLTGSTAGHWAAFSGAYVMLAALDAFGANMETNYDHYGLLPLHRALQLEYYATAKMLAELRPNLLEAKTKSGSSLEQFAEECDLSAVWFAEFLRLCRDPSSLIIPKRASQNKGFLMMGCENEGESEASSCPCRFKIGRRALWNFLSGQLLRLETSRIGRIFIPVLAILFAIVFTATWNLELADLNIAMGHVLRSIGGRPLEILVTRIPPYLGVISIVMFLILLMLDPGTIPKARERKTLFSRIQDHLCDVSFACRAANVRVGKRLTEWLETKGVTPDSDPSIFAEQNDEIRRAQQKQALGQIDPSRICPTCWWMKDLRTKHCALCDRCCRVMDHHCLWLNRCVGEGNHRPFFIFVVCAAVGQAYHILLVVIDIIWLILAVWAKVPHPTGPPSWPVSLLLMASACIHLTTYRWSLALVTSQISCIWEGYTINETLSLARYSHFLCRVVDPADETNGSPQEILTAAEKDLGGSGGGEIVDVENKFREVLMAAAHKGQKTMTRYFIRNPFTISSSGFSNCIRFWTGSVPTDVDWEAVAKFDVQFRREILAEVHARDKSKED